jgi:hypothetical protein
VCAKKKIGKSNDFGGVRGNRREERGKRGESGGEGRERAGVIAVAILGSIYICIKY